MSDFYNAPAIVRTVLTAYFLLLSICALAVVEYGIYAKLKKRHMTIIMLFAGISLAVFYCMRLAMLWAGETSTRIEFEKWILESVPSILWFILSVVLTVIYICCYLQIRKWVKRSISSISLKKVIDNLPAGLCFYNNQGQPLMMNYQFMQLCKEITGEFVINVLDFRRKLEEQRANDIGHGVIWHSADKHVWNFDFMTLEGNVNQIVGSDVTEIWQLNEDIRRENARIQKLNERLRDYNLNMEQVVKEDELLAARVRLHDDMGRILLMTRRYLDTGCPEEEKNALYQQWHNMLALFRNEEALRVENDPEAELLKAAESLGLKVMIRGELPESGRALKLLMSGARECMTNAAHHSADTIEIETFEDDGLTYIIYRNNGDEPEYPVHLGGGLSSLKRIAERNGAIFEIAKEGPFFVKIIIPLGREMN